MLLSYSTWGMPRVPIDIAVGHCAQLGFDGLELAVIPGWVTDAALLDGPERARIRRLYDESGLDLCGLCGNSPLLLDDAEELEASLARLRAYLDLAAELRTNSEPLAVSCTSGGAPADWDANRERLVERYGELARYAQSRDVMINAEPHVGAALHTPDQARWLVEQVGSPGLGIHFDISHFNVQGMDMDEVVSELGPICAHTHVKDERGVVPEYEFLIPGEGDMDYVRYLKGMERTGYRGHITVEISIMVQRRPDYDALAAATRSYEVLSAAFDTAGISRR